MVVAYQTFLAAEQNQELVEAVHFVEIAFAMVEPQKEKLEVETCLELA